MHVNKVTVIESRLKTIKYSPLFSFQPHKESVFFFFKLLKNPNFGLRVFNRSVEGVSSVSAYRHGKVFRTEEYTNNPDFSLIYFLRRPSNFHPL